MSMSTKIEDLPGSNIEEPIEPVYYQQPNPPESLQQLPHDILGDLNSIKNENLRQKETFDSNIKMNVKKRVRFEDEIEDEDENKNVKNKNVNENILTFLLNEENVLLLILFLLSSQTDFDRYPKSIPYIGQYINNPLVFTIIKCILLVLGFRLIERFILPQIKL
jgi:hypothetical protein